MPVPVCIPDTGGGESLTAEEILALLQTVDGPGSGLNADLLDGLQAAALALATGVGLPWEMEIALSDEVTDVSTGLAVTFRMPCAVTLNAGNAGVRLSANTGSSSGLPTVDVKEAGVTILSTKVTLDVNDLTSLDATTAVVISDTALADDAEMTVFVDVAGTGTKGLKLLLRGVRA